MNETPEAAGRRLLGEALYQRLARHLAPPLLEDLCQRVAWVVSDAAFHADRRARTTEEAT